MSLNLRQLCLELTLDNFPDENSVCGRPLGMAFDTISENLIVTDTANGIFELNVENGKKKQIVSSKVELGSEVRLN